MQAALHSKQCSLGFRGSASSRATQLQPVCFTYSSRPRSRFVQVSAKKSRSTGNEAIDKAIETGKGFVDSAASLVPESVPRPVAKGGVAVAGVLVTFWLLQKLVSTVLTIALLGGAAWFYFQYGGSKDDNGASNGGSRRDTDDVNDPLSEARKIMDKYK